MINRVNISSDYGPIEVIWTGQNCAPKIDRILIPKPGCSTAAQLSELYTKTKKSSCREMDMVTDAIRKILRGEGAVIPLDLLDLSPCSEFTRKILRTVHRIPRGFVCTYQTLAERSGCKNGSRAAGNVMAGNLFPLIIPCHRIIRSDGRLGNYGGGSDMKRSLLKNEGVLFDSTERIVDSGRCS